MNYKLLIAAVVMSIGMPTATLLASQRNSSQIERNYQDLEMFGKRLALVDKGHP